MKIVYKFSNQIFWGFLFQYYKTPDRKIAVWDHMYVHTILQILQVEGKHICMKIL